MSKANDKFPKRHADSNQAVLLADYGSDDLDLATSCFADQIFSADHALISVHIIFSIGRFIGHVLVID